MSHKKCCKWINWIINGNYFDGIKQIADIAGHSLFYETETTKLKGQCGSFMVEADVHYQRTVLLSNATRKAICLVA